MENDSTSKRMDGSKNERTDGLIDSMPVWAGRKKKRQLTHASQTSESVKKEGRERGKEGRREGGSLCVSVCE